ncbi:hypothetical protein ENBRE01_0942 [Enteropsectra breve]|nr:hypothetical protein ENBRE01_0942 [Enteropsectra breve]
MAGNAADYIKLRMHVLHMRFYLRIARSAMPSDLIKLTKTLVKLEYNMKISELRLKTIDGYEILKQFPLEDILENDQIVVVEPEVIVKLQAVTQKSPAAEETASKQIKTNSGKAVVSRTNSSEEQEKFLIPRSEEPKVKVMEKAARKEVASKTKENVEKDSASDNGNSSLDSTKNDDLNNQFLVGTAPSFPSNFKGFAISKKEMEKSKNSQLLASQFKPLKKKKVEDDYDIF